MIDPNLVGIVLVPSLAALLLLAVFTLLNSQSRQRYSRVWQTAWALDCGFYATAWAGVVAPQSALLAWTGKMCLLGVVMCLFASARMIRTHWRRERYDTAIVAVAAAWAAVEAYVRAHGTPGQLQIGGMHLPFLGVNFGLAALLGYTAYLFYRYADQRNSLAFRVLTFALGFWALLLVADVHRLFGGSLQELGSFLAPIPQLLAGVAMMMVLYEDERRTVQDNLLAFSSLDVDSTRLRSAEELAPTLERMLDRVLALVKLERGMLCPGVAFRNVLPTCSRGISEEWTSLLKACGGAESLEQMVYRRGGLAVFQDADELLSALPSVTMELRDRLVKVMARDGIASVTAASVQCASRGIGVLLLPRRERDRLPSTETKLLMCLAMQIGMTLDNYLLMHDAQRRTKEYALLTQIGQVVTSHLNPDEVLRAIHRELGQLFDNENFYVAFLDEKEVRYELEVEGGKVLPKRARKPVNGVAEHIVRTGKPLLVKAAMEEARAKLDIVATGKPSVCYCGVPIFFYGKPAGVMAAMSYEREYAFDERDLEIMQTAAGQLAVAMENARLFAEEKQRSRYLGFLNRISTAAISSQDADQMMAGIVSEIQKNFNFDHIGIGLVEYASKEIEIKAEAGTTARTLGRRIPLGVGIIGRVARSGDMALVQAPGDGLMGVFSESRSVLCIPMTYGETLLGVLNIESMQASAFAPEDVLILRTLADLLATALHNAFIFQKMQQQSITDGLTGVKTRRYFLEAVQAEAKRASRSGRPFSIVLIDLDKFKTVNDVQGHLEGDLVLARVGRLLEQKCRQSNVVARYGGDEFIILMPETSVEQAQVLSERLRLWIATDATLKERNISGSFGVASFPAHGANVEEIMRVADAGMYVSKHAGGNRVSTAHQLVDSEAASHDQVVRSYIEGFLKREQTGLESANELVKKLRQFGEEGDSATVQALTEAVNLLNRAAERRESRARGHGELVARYAEVIARGLGMTDDEISEVLFAARVHDVGKIMIAEAVLNKPGPLTPEETDIIKMHAGIGGEIVACIPGSARFREVVRHHHERFDGAGYPDGRAGEQIPQMSRIIAVADTFAEMIADRPFGKVRTKHDALLELQRLGGTQLDGSIVRVLVRELQSDRAALQGA